MSEEEQEEIQSKEEENKQDIQNENIQFKKVVYIDFTNGCFYQTVKPYFILYQVNNQKYVIGMSKKGKIRFYGDMVFARTSNNNIAISPIPPGCIPQMGRIVDFIMIDTKNTDDTVPGIIKIDYTRTYPLFEGKSIIMTEEVYNFLRKVMFQNEIIGVLDSLIYFSPS